MLHAFVTVGEALIWGMLLNLFLALKTFVQGLSFFEMPNKTCRTIFSYSLVLFI